MLISFFEEFPNQKALDKLKLINFKTKLYLAAESYKKFNYITSKIKNKYIKEFIYWPILKQEDGYWISPFSKKQALDRIFNENINSKIIIDCELPRNKLLYFGLFSFFKNKKFIKDFIRKNRVYTVEYYPQGVLKEILFNFLGLNFDPNKYNNKIIKMLYHSMHDFNEKFIKNEIDYGVRKYKDKYLVAYGTIAQGINKNERLLSSKQLDKDLKIAKECNIKEVIIYRLGGLNRDYLKVIKNYI